MAPESPRRHLAEDQGMQHVISATCRTAGMGATRDAHGNAQSSRMAVGVLRSVVTGVRRFFAWTLAENIAAARWGIELVELWGEECSVWPPIAVCFLIVF